MSLISKRTIFITVVLVAAAWLVISWLNPATGRSELLTAEVRSGSIEQTVIATGTLEAFRQVSVGAQVSGQIKKLNVALGDEVEQGELIAEIDSMPQQNNLADAKASLANIKAQRAAQAATLKQANTLFQRQKTLLARNATSREDYETAQTNLNTAQAQVDALDAQIEKAQIQVSTAEVNLGYTQITSPMTGTVVGLVVKEGQTVNSAQSAPTIVKIAQLDQMTVKAEISEADVIKVRQGQPVYFTILGEPGKRYRATLRMVEPAPNSINQSESGSSSASGTSSAEAIYYVGVFDVPNSDGKLRISMTAEVTIVLEQAKDVPTIPVSALGSPNPDGSYTVQVLDGKNKTADRVIRTGLENSINVQVVDGLAIGEHIVLGDASQGSPTAGRMSGRVRGMRL